MCVCAYNSIKLAPAPPPPGFNNAAKKREREKKKELIKENIEKIDAASAVAVRQKNAEKRASERCSTALKELIAAADSARRLASTDSIEDYYY